MKYKDKVSVITLGCSKNTVDSERLMNQIKLNNRKLVDDPDEAGTVIINTCGFIEAAKQESIDTILNAVSLKKQGKIKSRSPEQLPALLDPFRPLKLSSFLPASPRL